jgi:uncharacterized protein YjgD (DUF1641 family)
MVPSVYLEPRVLMFDRTLDVIDEIASVLCDTYQIETCHNESELFDLLANDRKIEDILDSCYVIQTDEEESTPISFKSMRMVLDFQDFAVKMHDYYSRTDFVSLVCIGEKETFQETKDLLEHLKKVPIGRVLRMNQTRGSECVDFFNKNLVTRVIESTDFKHLETLTELIDCEHIKVYNDN